MALATVPSEARAAWSWTAVLAGIIASLIIQALLTILALGIGLMSIDVPTANAAPVAISTAATLWWIASGVFAAFIGGAVTGALTPFADPLSRTGHALAAWAVAVLIVIGFSTLAAGTTATVLGTNIAGPGVVAAGRYQTVLVPRPGAAVPQTQVEQARKAIATGMLASFVGLLAGALAAAMGGWWSREIAEAAGTEPLGSGTRMASRIDTGV